MFDDNSYAYKEAQSNFEYCNIHGEPLNIFESDAGDLFVNLKDLKRTGFAIFRRETFDSLTIHPDEITQEFEYFLMSQAKKYILQNRAHSVDEERLLRTIENVKRKVIGTVTGDNKPQFKGQSQYKNQPEFRNPSKSVNQLDYRNHTYSRSRSGNINQDSPSQKYDNRNGNRSHISIWKQENQNSNVNLSLFGGMQAVTYPTSRPPKNLPNSFSVNRKYATASFKQKKRETTNNESFQNNTNEIQKQTATNSSTSSDCERNEKIHLEVGNIYEVEICYTEPEKDNVCWVHEKESIEQLQDMMVEIYKLEPSLETLNTLIKSQLVLGLYDDVWCRARIMLPNSNMVHFLDYGNKSVAERIKPLPDNLKKIPALAVRVVVNGNKLPLEEGQQLSVKVNRKYDDGTYLVAAIEGNSLPKIQHHHSKTVNRPSAQIKQGHTFRAHSPDRESVVSVTEDKPEKNIKGKFEVVEKTQTETKEETYLDIPKPLISLSHGDAVWIVDFHGGRLYLQTKECLEKRNEIRDYIKELDKSELVISKVKEGQLVLCSKEGMSNLCRAVVKEIRDSSVVKVRYIDFPGTDSLSIKSLRNIDKYLSKEPLLMLPTPKLDYLKKISVPAKNHIGEMIQKREELTVQISNKRIDFLEENGQLLSETLLSFNETLEVTEAEKSPKPSDAAPKQIVASIENERFFYSDIPRIELELGKHNFVCYSVEKPNDLTLVLDRDDIIEHAMFLLDYKTDINDAYKPELNEICLVYDDEDDRWFRAVVDGIEGDKYIMHGLDFGGNMSVTSDKLRSSPKYLKEIPIIGIRCELAGFIATPEMTDKFKNTVKEYQNLTANVLEFVDKTQKYLIEIPGLK